MRANFFSNFSRGEDVYLIRYKAGKYRDGIFSGQQKFKKRIVASIQPVTEADEVLMPDNLTRKSSVVKVYTQDELMTSDPASGTQADELEFGGKRYRIDVVADYSYSSLPHYECIAVMVDS